MPGSAERILATAEREQQHRFAMDHEEIRQQGLLGTRGQIFGAVIALACFGLAGYAFSTANAWAGTVISSVDLAGLVRVFVFGKRQGSSD